MPAKPNRRAMNLLILHPPHSPIEIPVGGRRSILTSGANSYGVQMPSS